MATLDSKQLSRRDFLKVSVVVAGGVAALIGLPQAALAARDVGDSVTVFRLSTTKSRSCNACKNHHEFKTFLSPTHADRNRAHPGCNCSITMQKLSRDEFRQLFSNAGAIKKGVVDLRSFA